MNPLKAIYKKVTEEPAVTLGVVTAAINAATVQTWEGYAVAIATALLRFAVTPVVKLRP